MPDTDPVAAELAAIEYRQENGDLRDFVTHDSPRLLAAVEAVLALVGKLEPQAPASSALEEDRMWIRQECADMIRNTITDALLGKENDDA